MNSLKVFEYNMYYTCINSAEPIKPNKSIAYKLIRIISSSMVLTFVMKGKTFYIISNSHNFFLTKNY